MAISDKIETSLCKLLGESRVAVDKFSVILELEETDYRKYAEDLKKTIKTEFGIDVAYYKKTNSVGVDGITHLGIHQLLQWAPYIKRIRNAKP